MNTKKWREHRQRAGEPTIFLEKKQKKKLILTTSQIDGLHAMAFESRTQCVCGVRVIRVQFAACNVCAAAAGGAVKRREQTRNAFADYMLNTKATEEN